MFLVNSIWTQEQHQQERDNMKDMLLEDMEVAMKVVIVGNGSVGKSSMIQRFCRGIFTRDYKKTIGVDFLERLITLENIENPLRLMLWDTAGQEEFDAITRTYYRGANACVLAFSVTDKDSFLALPKWKTKVSRECGDELPCVIVANKIDLSKQAVVDSSEIDNMARTLGIKKVFKTSVKEDVNVNSVFTHLAQSYMRTVISLNEEERDDEYLLPPPEEDTPHIHSSSSYPLFGNNNKSSNKNKKVTSNHASNNKGIFRTPVILKSGMNHHHNPHNLQNQRGFFSSAKNKIISQSNHHNLRKNHSNGNIGGIDRLAFPTFAPPPPTNGHSHHHPQYLHHHHTPRWNDTGKYDNMPFRLDLVKAKAKRRRDLCNIL